MRYLFVLLFVLVGCLPGDSGPQQVETIHSLKITVNAHRKGVKVYTALNQYLGLSPVTFPVKVREVKDKKTGIKRYFVAGEERHAGEKWPLKLKVYMEGFPEPVTVMVPFEPGQWQVEVSVKKR